MPLLILLSWPLVSSCARATGTRMVFVVTYVPRIDFLSFTDAAGASARAAAAVAATSTKEGRRLHPPKMTSTAGGTTMASTSTTPTTAMTTTRVTRRRMRKVTTTPMRMTTATFTTGPSWTREVREGGTSRRNTAIKEGGGCAQNRRV